MDQKLENFLNVMTSQGHRPATVAFVRSIAGQEMDAESFARQIRDVLKVRMPLSKAKNLFRWLVEHSIIRSNER